LKNATTAFFNGQLDRRPEVGLQALKLARMSTTNAPLMVMADSFARFHVVFSFPHFFLFAAPLNQFAESADRLLNGLAVPDVQLNHTSSFGMTLEQPHGWQWSNLPRIYTLAAAHVQPRCPIFHG
jgi:hypothetical protein